MIAVPFLSLLPKYVYSFLTSIAIWIIYLSGPYFAKTRYISLGAAFWILVVTFVFPWFDFMLTIIYSINYVWALALAFVFLYFFIKYRSSRASIEKCLLLFVFSYVIGWWHEGLSVPLLASILVYFFIERKFPDRTNAFMITGLACGILTIMCLPAFRCSVNHRYSVLFKPVLWETILGFCFVALFFIYMVMLGTSLIIKNKRKQFITDGILTFGITGTVVYLKYYSGPRVGTFIQMFSAMGIILLCNHKDSGYSIFQHILRFSSVITAFIFSLTSLYSSIPIQRKLTKEY